MSDIYADFGVINMASSSDAAREEHEEAMLSRDVPTRSGMDAIILGDGSEEDESGEDFEGTEEEQADDLEGHEANDDSTGKDEEFVPLGAPPVELEEAERALAENESGLQDMVADALERGVSQDVINQAYAEYEDGDGLSEKTYAALAEVGYTKGFIDSYLRGQEALGVQYGNAVVAYAGGQEKFAQMYQHLQLTSPESAEALENAVANRDINTAKAILNLAGASRVKTFGKPAARTVTKQALPAVQPVVKSEGYETKSDMMAAMKDSRYRRDAEYTRAVQAKVIASNFM